PAIGQSWVLYIQPNDLEDTHVQLADAGFPVSDIALTAYGAREFFVSDPDGYELWISVPVAAEDDDDDDDEGIKHSNDDDEDDDDDDDEDEEEEEEGGWRV
ncbi:MAG: hypothetical protein ABI612_14020, partial [Betaproteobacteria bacterium]